MAEHYIAGCGEAFKGFGDHEDSAPFVEFSVLPPHPAQTGFEPEVLYFR